MTMERIIYIADPEILAIPVHECHERFIDIKTCDDLAYGPPPETERTEPDYTKMRLTIYEKLLAVQQHLPNGWRLRLYEGFRSLAVQAWLFDNHLKTILRQHPHLDPTRQFQMATHLISPVKNLDGTDNIPPHNTGAAVDVELITDTGELVDMGMACGEWQDVPEELCRTICPGLTHQAQSNRLLLKEVMEAQGFVNYPTEWWHYSYGDRYWAYHTRQAVAIYGSVHEG